MNSVIKKLTDIEMTAERIVDCAEAEKGAIEKRIQAARDAFDEAIDSQTEEKLVEIKAEAEQKMNQILEDEKNRHHSVIDNLEKEFEDNHEAYAQEILERIIAV